MKKYVVLLLIFISISCTKKDNNPTSNNPINEEPFWVQTTDLGRRVDQIHIDSNDNIIVATAYGYLYRSTDNGNNWTLINEELTNKIFNIYSVVSNSKGYIYISTGQIYRTTNNGLNWVEVSTNNIRANYLMVDKNDNIYGVSCCGYGGSGIYRSTDNGNTWIKPINNNPNFTPASVKINSSNQLFANDDEDIYKSTDFGESWIKIKDEYAYSIEINKDDEIFCITGNALWKSLYKSVDDGITWERVSDVDVTSFLINDKNYFYGIKTTEGVMCSYDEGKNWKEINKGLDVIHVRSIALNSNGYLFTGTASYDNYNNLIKGEVYRSIKSTNN